MTNTALSYLGSNPKVKFFDANQELVKELGKEIISRLTHAINDKGHANLIVSGGSTPQSLFKYLSEQNIEWSKVTISLADERCVSQDKPNSNSYLLRQHLLRNSAAKATFIPLYEDDETPSKAAEHAIEKLRSIQTYDVVILGLGSDGHTASLFPQSSNLEFAMALNAPSCLAVDPVTNSTMRVSQSKVRLLNSAYISFHLVGDDKLEILKSVLADKEKTIYPASHFIHQHSVPVTIYFARNK